MLLVEALAILARIGSVYVPEARVMAKKTARKDQRKKNVGTVRGGKTNQYQPRGTRKIGRSKPGGDGPGRKKWTKE